MFPCCTQVSLLENLDPATAFPLEVLLGTATNNANGLNTAAPQLWMDPVGGGGGGRRRDPVDGGLAASSSAMHSRCFCLHFIQKSNGRLMSGCCLAAARILVSPE